MTSDLGLISAERLPSIFESFNARNLSPDQVARRFIPPDHFDDLVLRRHSLVVGPRGSGKTTLLKMLQLPALASWHHPEADRYREAIDFTGVFVAADVSWRAQLEALGQRALSPEITRVLGLAAFTTHVLIALLETMQDCTNSELRSMPTLRRHYIDLTKELEATLVSQLSTNWKLVPLIGSLHGLKLALRNRLSEISELGRREAARGEEKASETLSDRDFIHLGFLEAVIFGVEAFNYLAGNPRRKWALLFDELEIAPAEIRQALFRALRSTDSRLIFKLSLSPYHEDAELLQSSTSAMSGDDYQSIELWYPRKEEGYPFCESLLQSMLKDLGCQVVGPHDIFGSSEFDAGEEGRELHTSAYRPGTRVHKRFRYLAARDATFRQYLTDNDIDVDAMHKLSETVRAGLVRKITSIVAVREAYRSGGATERSRKNPKLYTGSRALFAITEGNPRWFIGLMGELLRRYSETGKKVARPVQARAVSAASSRFRALLRTIPFTLSSPATQKLSLGARGLLSLLDAIGEAFHDNVVLKDFTAEPVLSFTVDSVTAQDLLQALGRALNAGAIILIPDERSETLVSSLRGKRFRLSYLLAPEYGIPLTLGRELSLSGLLRPAKDAGPLLNWSNDDGR